MILTSVISSDPQIMRWTYLLPNCNRNCQCRRRLLEIFAVYALIYVVHDQLHKLMAMHDLCTEKAMRNMGLLCQLQLEDS